MSRRPSHPYWPALLPLMVGLGLLSISMLHYFPIIHSSYRSSPLPEYAEDPYGFLFFTSEDIIETATSSFLFSIDQVKYQEGTVHVHIFADFFLSMGNDSNGNSTFFVLQSFHNISDVSITINGQSPEDYGKKETIITYERSATAYLLIDIPREDIAGHIQVSINFIWKGAFWRHSFYKYNLVVSFNSAFPNYIHEVGLPKEAINDNGLLLPDITSRTSFSIAKPDAAGIAEAMPNPDVIGFSEGKVWYTWDIKKRSDRDRYASTAISIHIEVDDLKKEYESSWAYFTLCLGIGVPLLISSLIESIKIHYSKRVKKSSQQFSPKFEGPSNLKLSA